MTETVTGMGAGSLSGSPSICAPPCLSVCLSVGLAVCLCLSVSVPPCRLILSCMLSPSCSLVSCLGFVVRAVLPSVRCCDLCSGSCVCVWWLGMSCPCHACVRAGVQSYCGVSVLVSSPCRCVLFSCERVSECGRTRGAIPCGHHKNFGRSIGWMVDV